MKKLVVTFFALMAFTLLGNVYLANVNGLGVLLSDLVEESRCAEEPEKNEYLAVHLSKQQNKSSAAVFYSNASYTPDGINVENVIFTSFTSQPPFYILYGSLII
jgi:hypothetical protein